MTTIILLIPYFLIAISGAMAHVIAKFAKLEKEKRTFNLSTWWKANRWGTILGFILSLGSVVILFESNQLSYISCLLIGYTGDSLMKKEKED